MQFIEKLFHVKERGSTIKTEIIAGLIVFVAMCYILPVNADIMSSMGMSKQGVFAMTALVGAFVTIIMGVVANYPIVLSAGMGLNAYIAFTVTGFENWQQKMIILTITGILFFVFSLTPIRKKIIESIPKSIKAAISAALGGFIAYVGLKGSGVVSFDTANPSNIVPIFGDLANPGILIAVLSVILCFALMFVKNKKISQFAIPIAILFAAVVGVCTSCGIYYSQPNYQSLTPNDINGLLGSLPRLPWVDLASNQIGWGAAGIGDVVFFGACSAEGYSGSQFAHDLGFVFSQPQTYVAIFALMFVNLFDTTATLFAVGKTTGAINEDGTMNDYRKIVLADATGAAICAPLGTSTVTSFVESNVGTSLGAKTGLTAVVAALTFMLSAFIYPIFHIFTAPSVTAAALMCVGTMIFINNIKDIDLEDGTQAFAGAIIIIISMFTYSISNGIGIGLITYCLMKLVSGKAKEVSGAIYGISAAFIVLFALQAILPLLI